MIEITDEMMREGSAQAKPYAVVILRKGPNYNQDSERKILWEHGRRNYALRAEGILSIVCPIIDDGEFAGVGIFNRSAEEATELMKEDPAVKAEVLTYEVHLGRSFPGDVLPS